MEIRKIKLHNFRNYEEQEMDLGEGINVFFGDNAQGKTNILEAVFITAMGKSFRTKKEKELIKIGKQTAIIEIKYEKKDRKGTIKVEINDKKNIYLNGIKLNKMSEILGNINLVIFSPDDMEILKEGPQKRRKFLNMMISQLRPSYIHYFNLYSKALEQRNNYLRQIKYENKDESLLEIWDEKLAEYGDYVFKYREEFIKKIKEKINEIHHNITEGKEDLEMKYSSDCNNKKQFLEKLKENRKKDILKGFTSKGIHRDDFVIYLNDKEINIYGSQGQHRTAILSLKLAELYVIYDEIGEYPILLLDDFMSELDEKRRKNFISNITETQVLITGTHKIVLEKLEYNLYNIEKGKVKRV